MFGLLRSAGMWVVGLFGAGAAADVTLNDGKNLQSVFGGGAGAIGKGQADAGVESSFYGFYKIVDMIAKLLENCGLKGESTKAWREWAHEGMGTTLEAEDPVAREEKYKKDVAAGLTNQSSLPFKDTFNHYAHGNYGAGTKELAIDATTTAVGVVSGWAIGSSVGAAVGTAIPIPVVGTAVGWVVGGVGGYLIGEFGGVAARGVIDAGEWVWDGITDIFNSEADPAAPAPVNRLVPAPAGP